MTRGRWLAVAVVVLALIFAVEGGEYSTWNWLQLRSEEREEREAVARLRVEVDSLTKVALAVERDPKVQERVAREAFGMIRPGEFLYKLVPAEDSGR